MRTLLFFDGSRSTITNIQAAYQEQLQNTVFGNGRSTKILVSMFECLPEESKFVEQFRRYEQATENLLDQAIELAQNYGFNNLYGEIVYCSKTDITQTLANRANDWQADAVYLPGLRNYYSPPKPFKTLLAKFRQRTGRSTKSIIQPQLSPIPATVIPFSQIDLNQLMQTAHCPIVITSSKGIEMKIKYHSPTKSGIQKDKFMGTAELNALLSNKDPNWPDELIPTQHSELR